MTRLINRLSEAQIRNAVQPGMYPDGAGLYLQVTEAGSRSWVFRYGIAGKTRYMGLGPLSDVSLSRARKAAAAARAARGQGLDPIEARRSETATCTPSKRPETHFQPFAEAYIASRQGTWKSEKHRAGWRQSLTAYVYPVIGAVDVADVSTEHMLKILEPIWQTIPEMASRVRGRVERILAAAAVKGIRTAPNVALWKGHLAEALPPRRPAKHFDAMPYAEIPAFMGELRALDTVAAAALQFLILNASRTGEVLGARWTEVSVPARTWTVPADRMKMGLTHVVPLSDDALAILEEMKPLRGQSDYIFPGMKFGATLSTNALLVVLKKSLKRSHTVHGFRSTFRDWAGDCTEFPREVAEAALAHVLSDKTERAYRRSTALAKRRELMAAWAIYCGRTEAIQNHWAA